MVECTNFMRFVHSLVLQIVSRSVVCTREIMNEMMSFAQISIRFSRLEGRIRIHNGVDRERLCCICLDR